jgi:hypothetical protein
MDYPWTVQGLSKDSLRTPEEFHGLSKDSLRTLYRLSEDCLRTLTGPVGQCNIQLSLADQRLTKFMAINSAIGYFLHSLHFLNLRVQTSGFSLISECICHEWRADLIYQNIYIGKYI